MKRIFLFLFCTSIVFAQSKRSLNNDGVDLYKEKKFADAEVKFKKSLEKDDKLFQGHFNLGDAYYKQGRFDEAIQSYQNSLQFAENSNEKASVYHNIGNSLIKKQDFKNGIEAYKQSLKLNPNDLDTKYNLSYALNRMKQNQQNQNQQNKNDKNKDQNKDKNQQQNQNQNKQDQDKKNDQKQNQQQQQQKNQISKEEAQRILEAMRNNEKDMQKKLRKIQGKAFSTDKDW